MRFREKPEWWATNLATRARPEVSARAGVEPDILPNEARVQSGMEAAGVGTWDWNVVTGEQVWSDTSRALLGLTSESPTNLDVLMNRIHPYDREAVRAALDDAVVEGKDYCIEFRTLWSDGSVHWIWAKGRVFRDQGGRAVRMSGVAMNIDDRKLVENDAGWKTAFLEAQVDATIDGILVLDAQGKMILQNKQFVDLWQMPPEIARKTDDAERVQYAAAKTRNPQQFLEQVDYLYRHPSETSRDEIEFTNGTVVDRYSSPVIGKNGEYYGRIWTFRDITERKHTEGRLRQLSLAVEQSPVSIVITDPQGKITYVNRKFTTSTGYASEEVLGHTPSVLKSGYTSSESYKTLWETIAGGGEWRGEFHNKKKNGDLYWESAVITPIKDTKGNVSHFIAIKEDITEQRALETQLRQAQKLEAIGQLAAGIAHEINTPAQYVSDNTTFLKQSWESILSVLSVVRQLREEASNAAIPRHLIEQLESCWEAGDIEYLQAEIPRAIEQSLDGIQRVSKIVRAMKEFSHPGSEDKRSVDINKSIETTITVARNEWKYVADVETRFEASLPFVPCHAGEFNQVILNLLVNSAHAIAEAVGNASSGKGKIVVTTRRDGDWVEVSVGDNGAGIPISAQARIFEPFFTTKPVGKGTGQGLALAHNTIVNRHGGKIWFTTEVGKGTTFFLRLPTSERSSDSSC